jgi:hypothetical protein
VYVLQIIPFKLRKLKDLSSTPSTSSPHPTMAPPNDNQLSNDTAQEPTQKIESTDEKMVSELPPTEMIYYTYEGCFEYEW